MPTHPDIEDLVVYAERGSLSGSSGRTVEIEEHLRNCNRCLREVAELRTLRDLDADGLLILPSDKATARREGSKWKARLEKQLGGDAKPVKLTTLGILGGLFAAGLTSTGSGEPSFASHHNVPGDRGKDFSGEDESHVRNAVPDASVVVNEPHSHETGGEDHQSMTPSSAITRADPIIGTPGHDSGLFPGQQSYPDTCAIRCQEFIIRQYTGTTLPEKYYIDEAKSHGWYREGEGTPMRDVGKILELHGIPVHRYSDANIFNLTAELAQGHKVIIGVDSDDLWNPILSNLRHTLGLSAADHTVVVSGIDTSDTEHVQVIVSDPGTGDVKAKYPMEQFVTAWKDSHFFMVATQNPPPAELHLPEMQNFDYHAGHVDNVGSLPYQDFLQLVNSVHHQDDAGGWPWGQAQTEHLLDLINRGHIAGTEEHIHGAPFATDHEHHGAIGQHHDPTDPQYYPSSLDEQHHHEDQSDDLDHLRHDLHHLDDGDHDDG